MAPVKKPVPKVQCPDSSAIGASGSGVTRFLPSLGAALQVDARYLEQASAQIRGRACDTCRRVLRVRGHAPMVSTDGRAWVATALCVRCGATVGLLEHAPELPAGVRIEAAE